MMIHAMMIRRPPPLSLLLPILQVQDNELAYCTDLTMPAANRPPGDSKASEMCPGSPCALRDWRDR